MGRVRIRVIVAVSALVVYPICDSAPRRVPLLVYWNLSLSVRRAVGMIELLRRRLGMLRRRLLILLPRRLLVLLLRRMLVRS